MVGVKPDLTFFNSRRAFGKQIDSGGRHNLGREPERSLRIGQCELPGMKIAAYAADHRMQHRHQMGNIADIEGAGEDRAPLDFLVCDKLQRVLDKKLIEGRGIEKRQIARDILYLHLRANRHSTGGKSPGYILV